MRAGQVVHSIPIGAAERDQSSFATGSMGLNLVCRDSEHRSPVTEIF